MEKQFVLDDMLSTFGHTFYPTNHIMILSKEDFGAVIEKISHLDYYVFTAQEIISEIGYSIKDNDEPLPSVGTEGATVRGYIELAKEGFHGLLIKVDDNLDEIMNSLKDIKTYTAKHYRMLVIEDLSKPSTAPVYGDTDIVKEQMP